MQPHTLTSNIGIQIYYQFEGKFNGVYSRNNLSKIKDEASVIILDVFKSIGTHKMSLDISGDTGSKYHNVTYFDSFGVKYIPKGIWKFIGDKNITANIYRKQAYDSIMCRKFCVGFISFMIKGTKFLDYTNLFSTNQCEYNSCEIIVKYFGNSKLI